MKKIVFRSGVDASFWRVVTAFSLVFRSQSLRYFKQQKGRLKNFQTTAVGNRRVVYTFSTADSFCFCLNDS